jgi:catechol 2,3-dioxygenase-like lactoylglutathione lyase family enzyme
MSSDPYHRDIERSVAFYREVLGPTVLRQDEATLLRLANIWRRLESGVTRYPGIVLPTKWAGSWPLTRARLPPDVGR